MLSTRDPVPPPPPPPPPPPGRPATGAVLILEPLLPRPPPTAPSPLTTWELCNGAITCSLPGLSAHDSPDYISVKLCHCDGPKQAEGTWQFPKSCLCNRTAHSLSFGDHVVIAMLYCEGIYPFLSFFCISSVVFAPAFPLAATPSRAIVCLWAAVPAGRLSDLALRAAGRGKYYAESTAADWWQWHTNKKSNSERWRFAIVSVSGSVSVPSPRRLSSVSSVSRRSLSRTYPLRLKSFPSSGPAAHLRHISDRLRSVLFVFCRSPSRLYVSIASPSRLFPASVPSLLRSAPILLLFASELFGRCYRACWVDLSGVVENVTAPVRPPPPVQRVVK